MERFDYFSLREKKLDEILDSSIDPSVVKARLKEYNYRKTVEGLYRKLHIYDVIDPENAYTSYYNEVNGIVYFECDFEKYVNDNPNWANVEMIKDIFNEQELMYWLQLTGK